MLQSQSIRTAIVFTTLAAIAFILGHSYTEVNIDEGTYLAVGMLFSKGQLVYRDVFESKPPIFHFINAAEYMAFGNSIYMARFIVTLASAGTGTIIHLLTKKTCSEKCAFLAGVFFAVFSSSPWLDGFSVMTEPYATFTTWTAIYLMLTTLSTRKSRETSLLAGVFFALSILIRFTVVLPFLITVIWFLLAARHNSPSKSAHIIWTFLGICLPTALVMLFFVANGAFGDMISWVLEPLHGFNRNVVVTDAQKTAWLLDIIEATLPIWILSVLGVLRKNDNLTVFVSAIGVALILILKFTPLPAFHHYYYEILPVLCILAAKGANNIGWLTGRDTASNPGKRKFLFASATVLILFIIVGSSFISAQFNFRLGSEYASSQDMILIDRTSEYIVQNTPPNDKIFVFEGDWPKIGPYIYYRSERMPPIKNLFFFPWSMTKGEANYITNTLDTENVTSIVVIGHSPQFQNARYVYQYIQKHYRPVYVIASTYTMYKALDQTTLITIYERR